jgi:hypothetical protein
MKPLAEDTPLEVERIQVELIRRLSPAEKMARFVSLNRSVRAIARAGVRKQYPVASEREIDLRTAARWLDAETMRRAFGWDPDAEAVEG